MIVAVASGKGGTGKTTVAVNLALAHTGAVQLLDCDVEAPNSRLFLAARELGRDPVHLLVPEVDPDLCQACGECSRICQYHAIVSLGTEPLVFPELCHGCGGCARVCPCGAIAEAPRTIGTVGTFAAPRADAAAVPGAPVDLTLVEGRLEVGVATAPPVIVAVKRRRLPEVDAILDAPPGTSCPVVTTLRGVDFVVLVTEPTPFGLHDLGLAVDLVRAMGLPAGVVVNRHGSGDDRVHRYCAREGLPLLAEIPDDRRVAEAYARGQALLDAVPGWRPLFADLWRNIADEFAIQRARRRHAGQEAS